MIVLILLVSSKSALCRRRILVTTTAMVINSTNTTMVATSTMRYNIVQCTLITCRYRHCFKLSSIFSCLKCFNNNPTFFTEFLAKKVLANSSDCCDEHYTWRDCLQGSNWQEGTGAPGDWAMHLAPYVRSGQPGVGSDAGDAAPPDDVQLGIYSSDALLCLQCLIYEWSCVALLCCVPIDGCDYRRAAAEAAAGLDPRGAREDGAREAEGGGESAPQAGARGEEAQGGGGARGARGGRAQDGRAR